jgi:hypothetical protein
MTSLSTNARVYSRNRRCESWTMYCHYNYWYYKDLNVVQSLYAKCSQYTIRRTPCWLVPRGIGEWDLLAEPIVAEWWTGRGHVVGRVIKGGFAVAACSCRRSFTICKVGWQAEQVDVVQLDVVHTIPPLCFVDMGTKIGCTPPITLRCVTKFYSPFQYERINLRCEHCHDPVSSAILGLFALTSSRSRWGLTVSRLAFSLSYFCSELFRITRVVLFVGLGGSGGGNSCDRNRQCNCKSAWRTRHIVATFYSRYKSGSLLNPRSFVNRRWAVF